MATVTFQVNLETVDNLSTLLPNTSNDAVTNFRETRVCWIPDELKGNIKLTHGDQFTVSGRQAQYLKNTYTSGDNAILTVVSEGITFSAAGEPVSDKISK